MAWPDVIPYIRYQDPKAMIDWLEQAFGFKKHAVHEDDSGTVVHAEVTFGSGMFMLGAVREHDPDGARTPRQLDGKMTGGMYVIVDDPDAHYERARAAGAEIMREVTDQDYGSRDYAARDPEGHAWSFGTYRPE